MSIYDNSIGIAIPMSRLSDGGVKYYFIVNNQGVMNYSSDEKFLKDIILGSNSIQSDDFRDLNIDVKNIFLKDYSISTEIIILNSSNTMNGKSYFELTCENEDEDSFNMAIFAYNESNIRQLYDYVKLFCMTKNDEIEEKININENNSQLFSLKSVGAKSLRDKKHMEEILAKLEGKFVNQDEWDKECIKIVNPSSDKDEYEESWVKLENGSDYSGPVKNGMPHGFGKEFRKDGLIYTGNFYQGKWHGSGNITNINLDSYQGEFIDGCICGI